MVGRRGGGGEWGGVVGSIRGSEGCYRRLGRGREGIERDLEGGEDEGWRTRGRGKDQLKELLGVEEGSRKRKNNEWEVVKWENKEGRGKEVRKNGTLVRGRC